MENLFFKIIEPAIEKSTKSISPILWKQTTTYKNQFMAESTIKQINANPGFAFFLVNNDLLFYGKIINVYNNDSVHDITDEKYLIPEFYEENNKDEKEDVFAWIELEYFRRVDLEILQYLYARNQKQNKEKSLYKTYYLTSYKYSRPIMDESEPYVINKINKLTQLREELLYDNKIIPTNHNKETYGTIIEEDEKLIVTLTNEKMLRVDKDYLNNEFNSATYRPYFYEFIPENMTENQLQIMELEKNQMYLVELNYLEEKDNYLIQEEYNGNKRIRGEIIFSASPSVHISAYLTFRRVNIVSHQEIDSILNDSKEVSNSPENIEEEFTSALQLLELGNIVLDIEIQIYNIGQANWIQIIGKLNNDRKFSLIFDMGSSITGDKKKYQKNLDKAAEKAKNNDLFMLSHWDLDHIKGVSEIEEEYLKKTWIVPDLPPRVSNAAKRLAAYLIKEDDISETFISSSLEGRKLFDNNFFALGKGKGTERGRIVTNGAYRWKVSYTMENNLGLILEVKNKGRNVLLTGDCEYIEFPLDFMKEYFAIIVPHHGAKIEGISLPDKNGNNRAIACVGKKTNYPHQDKHVNFLQNRKGYTVESTRDSDRVFIEIKI